MYVNNFAEPRRPRALRLPPGRATRLAQGMERLVDDLLAAIPAAFESDDYRTRRQSLEDEFKESHERSLEELQKRAAEKSVAVIQTPMGLAVAPVRDNDVIRSEDFQTMPESERTRYQSAMDEIQTELQNTFHQMPKWEREHRQQVNALDDEFTGYVVGHLIDELAAQHRDVAGVTQYLKDVRRDVIKNASDFRPHDGKGPQTAMLQRLSSQGLGGRAPLERYQVNVIVGHPHDAEDTGAPEGVSVDPPGDERLRDDTTPCAPVVEEDNPTQPNLVGRIEHVLHLGAVATNFTMIKPGALHKANGGYLILDARKLLM